MTRKSPRSFAAKAYHVSCLCTILLSLLGTLSGLMIRIGQQPLLYTILTRQILHQIPVLFLCGILCMLLCDILERLQSGSKS